MALPVFAGTSAKQAIAPPPNPCLMSWFTGASVGYLTELEEPMYTVHVGVTDSCWVLGGWNVGIFAEVGYTTKSESYRNRDIDTGPPPVNFQNDKVSVDVDEMGRLLQWVADIGPSTTHTSYDLDIVPITLNVKFERVLSGDLSAYIGGGLGVAIVDLDLSASDGKESISASDTACVFAGQIFGGLNYNVSPNFAIYGGARWIYMSDADLSDSRLGKATLQLGSDCLLELGARYKF